MFLRALALSLAALIAPIAAFAQAQTEPIDASEIASLLALGRANRLGGLVRECTARKPSTAALVGLTGLYGIAAQALAPGNNVFAVRMVTARGHIADIARRAMMANETVGLESLSDVDRLPALYVRVAPRMPDTNADIGMIPAPVTSVSLVWKLEARDVVMSPDEIRDEPVVWRSTSGATVDYVVRTAVFSGSKLRGAPGAEIMMNLVVDTQEGVRACEIPNRDFRRLLRATR